MLQAAAVIGTERLLPSLESNPKYAENVSAFGLIDTVTYAGTALCVAASSVISASSVAVI